MARALWSGSISFGLLNIPVKIYNAVRPRQLHFRLLHQKDKVPLKQKLVCPADKKEVDRTDAARGYTLTKNELVVIEDKEFKSLMPKASHTIEILDFVSIDSIDPIYFHQPYYAVPEEHAEKTYALFRQS